MQNSFGFIESLGALCCFIGERANHSLMFSINPGFWACRSALTAALAFITAARLSCCRMASTLIFFSCLQARRSSSVSSSLGALLIAACRLLSSLALLSAFPSGSDFSAPATATFHWRARASSPHGTSTGRSSLSAICHSPSIYASSLSTEAFSSIASLSFRLPHPPLSRTAMLGPARAVEPKITWEMIQDARMAVESLLEELEDGNDLEEELQVVIARNIAPHDLLCIQADWLGDLRVALLNDGTFVLTDVVSPIADAIYRGIERQFREQGVSIVFNRRGLGGPSQLPDTNPPDPPS